MNIIKFIAPKDYLDAKDNYPKPIKTNLPEWFKKLNHSVEKKTIKGCIPFLETLTTGYLLRLPVDTKIEHYVDNGSLNTSIDEIKKGVKNQMGLNMGTIGYHPVEQVTGCPFEKKNGEGRVFHKIANPWTIKTPPGYSCLFIPPLNNTTQDFFEIIPGIVHTDTFELEINFPIILNAEKYTNINTIFKRGLPYVQIIPFKRDDWQMKIETKNNKKASKNFLHWTLSFLHRYREKIYNKNKTKWL
jgi:hypothetical protein|tara:strand:- start:2249 stop:2980 length:732 start_codon:yes stop_codon:yes gene_type:complete